jgi:hypothetical protein
MGEESVWKAGVSFLDKPCPDDYLKLRRRVIEWKINDTKN